MLFELVPVRVRGAANDPWLALGSRQEVTVTQIGEYTRIVLTRPDAEATPVPQPAWA
ncbi:MAG TPA: hypothetical protein VEU32_06850 [Burkholderiales bacterium]|nr:hypothetical protein [Burkholderiales bacterium]